MANASTKTVPVEDASDAIAAFRSDLALQCLE